MKHALLWVSVVVTIASAGLHAQTIQVDKNNRTIAITATDKASAEADTAIVSVGFRIYAPDAPSAYAQGSQISNAVTAALKKAGIPDASIESQDQKLAYTDFPENDKSTPAQRAQKQFTLSQTWTVHVAAKDAAITLHTAIEAGANDSGNIDWDLTTREALQAKAAENALERARKIAAQMAGGLNAHLGALVYASNQAPMLRVLLNTENAELATVQAIAAPPAPLAIRPQQVEESATVYAVFSIE
jgi:uncharacterized protein YggE